MIFSDKGNEVILKALDNIDSFINNKINSIPQIEGTCTGFNAKIKDQIRKNNSSSLKIKNDEELKVYGEVMLISEKLTDGNINDIIHHTEYIK
jgi:methyl-accepting chemotaxis protein